jgi:hypothetical protein
VGGASKRALKPQYRFGLCTAPASSLLLVLGWPEQVQVANTECGRQLIANFCFLIKNTNLEIRDKLPKNYFPMVEEDYPGALASQWIPMDERLWEIENYPDFLSARRKLLAAEANKRLAELLHGDVSWLEGTPAAISDKVLIWVSFGSLPSFTPFATARARPSLVRARIKSRSNSAKPPSTVSIKRPCAVVVSAHVSPSDRKPAPLLGDRSQCVQQIARRSRKAIKPHHHKHVARPELNEKTAELRAVDLGAARCLAPHLLAAARNCFTCASTLWPSVDTLA